MDYAINNSSTISAAAKESAYKHYLEAVNGKSNTEARDIAADIIGANIQWNWDCVYLDSIIQTLLTMLNVFQYQRHVKDTTTIPAV